MITVSAFKIRDLEISEVHTPLKVISSCEYSPFAHAYFVYEMKRMPQNKIDRKEN